MIFNSRLLFYSQKWNLGFNSTINSINRGGCRNFEKRVLYVSQHGWPREKILGFRWSKKAKITLNLFLTKYFFQHFQILSNFTYHKSWWWNLINFPDFANTFVRKETTHTLNAQWVQKNWEKIDFALLQIVL